VGEVEEPASQECSEADLIAVAGRWSMDRFAEFVETLILSDGTEKQEEILSRGERKTCLNMKDHSIL